MITILILKISSTYIVIHFRYARLNGLKANAPHLKTLIAVGGWTFQTKNMTQMLTDANTRNHFVQTSITFFRVSPSGLLKDRTKPPKRICVSIAFTVTSNRQGSSGVMRDAIVPTQPFSSNGFEA